jgi:putative ABC transport system substrate-binding protein
VRRRAFITLLGGAAVAWPLAAGAQQPERVKRIGVLLAYRERDPEGQTNLATLRKSLHELGWTDGRNIQIDDRWAAGNAEQIRSYAVEFARMALDVIVGVSTPVLQALRQEIRSIPIVFIGISDPEGAGFVASLARPGGNTTGFANFEPSIGGKWLQLLKELVPPLAQVAVLRNPAAGAGFIRTIETVARPLGVEPVIFGTRDAGEIAHAIETLVGHPNSGLIVLPDPLFTAHRHVIIDLAGKHHLPAIYPFRLFAADGGLITYGVDLRDQFRRAGGYVDRILRGASPAQLPVQAPDKFELAINLRTAKTLGIEVPPHLQQVADEVIE